MDVLVTTAAAFFLVTSIYLVLLLLASLAVVNLCKVSAENKKRPDLPDPMEVVREAEQILRLGSRTPRRPQP
jgi:hypothetical protein